MKLRVETRDQVRRLRRKGHSYREIRAIFPDVAKSTLSNWVQDIRLSHEQQKRLIEKMRILGLHGRQKGALANHEARLKRIQAARREATKTFPALMMKPIFPLGLVLYSAEGSKVFEMFQFINSDPNLIQLMLLWVEEICHISLNQIRARIYIHKIYANNSYNTYWQTVTGLPVEQFRKTFYKPTPHKIKRNENYMGCCRIEISGVQFFWKIKTWQELLFKYYLRPRGEMDITADFESAVEGSNPSEDTY